MATKRRRAQLGRTLHGVRPVTPTPAGVRERILEAALSVMRESGVRRLSQVQVAQRAGVRQSHLTYYFPTRDDLLRAVTRHAVDRIASGLGRVIPRGADVRHTRLLRRLAASVSARSHMRMFVAMIVEADGDPAVRAVMRDATGVMETRLAEALGGDDSRERARLILAAVWGLGLYQFLMRPASGADPTRAYLAWLAHASPGRKAVGIRRPKSGE